jgi:hypothetical protein
MWCQVELEEEKGFKMIAPDKTEAYICAECMNDVLKFIKSGQAEKEKLDTVAPLSTPILFDRKAMKLGERIANKVVS